jgi:hypothetical protein
MSVGLDAGEALALWYRPSFDWEVFIIDFDDTYYIVHQWDILFFKVEDTESWDT